MSVFWTVQAQQDRAELFDFINADRPRAAIQMDQLFSNAAQTLNRFPNRGRPGAIAGTRELIPHDHYRLVYENREGDVWILALVHTARAWPPLR